MGLSKWYMSLFEGIHRKQDGIHHLLSQACYSHAGRLTHGCLLESSRCECVSVQLLALAGSAAITKIHGAACVQANAAAQRHWSEDGTLVDTMSFVTMHVFLPGPNAHA